MPNRAQTYRSQRCFSRINLFFGKFTAVAVPANRRKISCGTGFCNRTSITYFPEAKFRR